MILVVVLGPGIVDLNQMLGHIMTYHLPLLDLLLNHPLISNITSNKPNLINLEHHPIDLGKVNVDQLNIAQLDLHQLNQGKLNLIKPQQLVLGQQDKRQFDQDTSDQDLLYQNLLDLVLFHLHHHFQFLQTKREVLVMQRTGTIRIKVRTPHLLLIEICFLQTLVVNPISNG